MAHSQTRYRLSSADNDEYAHEGRQIVAQFLAEHVSPWSPTSTFDPLVPINKLHQTFLKPSDQGKLPNKPVGILGAGEMQLDKMCAPR